VASRARVRGSEFRRRYPGVDVHVTDRADAEIEQDLIGRRVDIGLVRLWKMARTETPAGRS
jgi:DNA-binding transcriptional LysR family regulator